MNAEEFRSEKYRPLVHFSPRTGWINDPNGLVYHNGEYHLFYQHHPYSNELGPMHWGHAVSRDLIHWTELPVALYPDHNGVIFSGSATVDQANSAGFGENALIAVYTSHDDEARPIERQSLAYSVDNGRHFAKYYQNPVLFPPPHSPDFRDPRVFWYGKEEGHWVMVLAAGDEVQFFRSDDLKRWAPTGAFGRGHGAHGGVWECPDLFPLEVEGEGIQRWVLVVGINPGGQAKGSGTQYFIGDFDGRSFTNANPPEAVLWLDWGADAYATQSWDGMVDGRRVITSWMSNWLYARVTPTQPWRGSMTLPREVTLVRTREGLRVAQRPVAELARYYGRGWKYEGITLASQSEVKVSVPALACLDLRVEMMLGEGVQSAGVRLRDGLLGLVTVLWDRKDERVSVDRSASGVVDFHPDFAAAHGAPFHLENDRLVLRVMVDAASIELFAGQGEVTITDSIYLREGEWQIALFAEGDGAEATVYVREIMFNATS